MLVTNMYLYIWYAEISVAIRSREQMVLKLVFFQKKTYYVYLFPSWGTTCKGIGIVNPPHNCVKR